MSAYNLIEELKFHDMNFDTTLLPKHNPYVGYFPCIWPLIYMEPKFKDASTQTDSKSYYKLGEKVAKEYGEGWELLFSNSGPTVGGSTQ